ncbi:PKD domain-containing protein [Hymenobacter guriensis]|uniref:PKD domain-containing protein n=1 Tax=Hymenobacter guriensis TaxID=2793065 RepID=A0ABS0L6Z0_9BACT|nr:PKD domain-containing protein [Hymenobacter guriensis]MBG8555690.1 PKD domain-containing protein [Hymenobacter guriensis]
MKHIVRVAMLGLMLAPALLTSCEKEGDDYTLEGSAPQASFTTTVKTTEFPTVVNFTNTTKDGFLYQWDFGDGSPLEKGQNVTHVYKRPGTYKVTLISAGRGGTGFSEATNVVVAAPTSPAFVGLTNSTTTGNRAWILSNQAGAITKYAADGTTVLSSSEAGGIPACQADDEVTFTSTYAYSYSAGDQTYSNGACGDAKTGTSDFIFTPTGTTGGKITLQKEGSFIGETTPTKSRTYEIVEVSETTLKLRTENADGTFTQYSYRPQLSALDRVKLLLTGATSKTWMLQNDVDAPIVVGTESNPSAYFPGVKAGELPTCQSDDEYTFSASDKFTYNAKGETYVAGPYACQAPRSGTSDFSFGPADGEGIAMFEFKKAGTFIGVTDAPDLTYRIISIDDTHMVIRAGRPSGTVFQMKLVAKP